MQILIKTLLFLSSLFITNGFPNSNYTTSLVITGYGSGKYSNKKLTNDYLTDLKEIGANTASILMTCMVKNDSDSKIKCHTDDSPNNEELQNLLKDAKAAGFKTNLRVYVDLSDQKWRCYWNPKNKKEAFKNLKNVLMEYSTIAQKNNVDSLIIGAEYCKLTGPKYTANWVNIISELRKVYKGEIGYGANLSIMDEKRTPEYENVKFWGSLDFVGIDHYWPFEGKAPTLENLKEHQKNIFEKYKLFHEKINKKIIITEMAFPGAKNSSFSPAIWDLPPPSDENEQAINYEAFFSTLKNYPFVEGVFVWRRNAEASDVLDPKNELDYELKGRKAWEILKTFLKELK